MLVQLWIIMKSVLLPNLGKLRHTVVYAGPAKTPKMMGCWAVILISGKKNNFIWEESTQKESLLCLIILTQRIEMH